MNGAQRFAVFPRGIDGLLMPPRPGRTLLLIVEAGRPEAAWAARFAPERVVTYHRHHARPLQALGTGELLAASDIAAALHGSAGHGGGAPPLVLHGSRTHDIDGWARSAGIAVVAAAPRLARELEHKIRFDAFLAAHRLAKPRSVSGRADALDPLPFAGGAVVQRPESMGGEGTFFLPPGATVRSLIDDGTLAAREPCLVRERVDGACFGVTLLVTDALCALSALRVQCYYPAPRGALRKVFAGVQWLPRSALSVRRARNVEAVCLRLARALQRKGFRGFANVDFMCTGDDAVRIIECNPRPSAATPCLYVWPELVHGLPADALYLAAVTRRARSSVRTRSYGLPQGEFSGSVLDIPADVTASSARTAKRGVQSGVYALARGGALRFVSPDPRALGPRGTLFAYGSVRRGERFGADDTLVNVCSSVALFDARGRLNARGRRVLHALQVT